MAILMSDLKLYLGSSVPSGDTTAVGGAIAATSGTALKVTFKDLTSTSAVQVISSNNTDTAPITIFGRDSGGAVVYETQSLVGATLVSTTATFERFLGAFKSATTVGDISIEKTTKTRSNTSPGAAAATSSVPAYIRLDSSASGTNDIYNNYVIRIPAGTGSGQIREIIDYDGATQRAYVNRDWDTLPASGDPFHVVEGIVLDKWPVEISGCRRMFWAAEAEALGGNSKSIWEKVYVKNTHASLTLTNAKIQMTQDLTTGSILNLGVESGVNLSTSIANRLTAPTSVTNPYNESLQDVPGGGNLTAGSYIGIYISGLIPAGNTPEKSTFTITTTGSST